MEKVLEKGRDVKENPEKEPVIIAKEISKSFGDHHVLRNLNFSLLRNENMVVLGKSGTGKSVLIKCIVRLICPDSGELNVLGKNVTELDKDGLLELRQKVGFLFQGGALYDSMTVKENMEFPLLRQKKKMSKGEIKDAVEEALKNVGLIKAINKMPSELSGGMEKRIALARTLIQKPEIMLYDEPTTGLDPVTSKDISHLILKMQEKYNMSSIIITHDIACAKITSNKIYILKDGHFIAEGSYTDLENSKDNSVRSFFE